MIPPRDDAQINLRRWRSGDSDSNSEQLARVVYHLPRAIEEELTERQLQILKLHFYEDLSVSQIAHLLGVNPSTVSRSLQRSTAKLQRILRYTL